MQILPAPRQLMRQVPEYLKFYRGEQDSDCALVCINKQLSSCPIWSTVGLLLHSTGLLQRSRCQHGTASLNQSISLYMQEQPSSPAYSQALSLI